jgi:hypothetical protein
MAYISKTGITNTSTIDAEHITRIIDALDGTAATEVSASGQFDGSHSGSFSGSFIGDGTNITGVTAEWDGTHNGNANITGSLTVTGEVIAENRLVGSIVRSATNLTLEALTVTASAAALLVTGTVSGSNLSGTNTGDQDLSSYAQTANVVANSATASFTTNSETASFAITGSDVLFGNITGSDVSASANILGDRIFATTYISSRRIESPTLVIAVQDNMNVSGQITASGHISCSSAQSIMTATTGAFNHIITDGDTIEFKNATTRAKIGSLKFDPTRGLDVQDENGNEGKMRAKAIDIPAGGSLIVSASQVDFTGLPSVDPRLRGRMWNDRGTVKISTGD